MRQATSGEFAELDALGLSISSTDNQRHCGFLFKSAGAVRHLHLAWHELLQDEVATVDVRFVNLPAMHAINKTVVCAALSGLKKNGLSIPYGFHYRGLRFDSGFTHLTFESDGALGALPPGFGLTCATFVIVALDSLGFDLIDDDTWPARPSDAEWQKTIVGHLRRRNVAHADALEADIGLIRPRPEEVVGAGAVAPWPVKFAAAESMAQKILSEIAAA